MNNNLAILLRLLSLGFLLHFGAPESSATGAILDSIPATQPLQLLFVGDVMGHGPQIRSAKTKDGYDYQECFRYVKPLIQKADLAIANLEVTLPGKKPYQGYPRFRSPDALAEALREAGFDLLVTANNHSNDAGRRGVQHTIQVAQERNFLQTGTFSDARHHQLYYPLIIYRKGYKLAFLNYTYDTNKLPTIPPTLVNEIDENLIERDLQAAKALKPDFIIVVMHWGEQYKLKPSRKQVRLAQKMAKWGADLIVGSHPHVVQPIRYEAGNAQDSIPVAYSLGNFISNQKQPYTDIGIMYAVSLQKDEAGKVAVTHQDYTPVYRYRKKKDKKTTFYTVPTPVFLEASETVVFPKKEVEAVRKKDAFVRQQLGRLH